MRNRIALISACAVGIVVALLVVVLATRDPAVDQVRKSPLIGKPAPELHGTDLQGQSFNLANYASDFVLVNFFATWCVPCRQEHPELVKLSESGAADVVSVVYQDSPETVQAFLDEQGGDWPVIEDKTGQTTLSYGIAKIPESYLIAPGGTVVAKFISGVDAATVTDVIDRFR
jgi:cytochrome c biogenesis protein CcmG, thiol:disulfide interchange protein DsbE